MTTPLTGETWGENVEAVRGFFLHEAEQPLDVLRSKLQAARTEFSSALHGVSERQAEFTPASGEGEAAWGIAEVLRHIASVEPIMAQRVRLLGFGQSVEGLRRTHPGYLQDVDTRRQSELLGALEHSYAALLDAIAEIAGRERLDTVAPHRRYGELNCRGWIALHTAHIQDHTRQIGKIKLLPGYPPA